MTIPKRNRKKDAQMECEEKYKIVANGTYDWEFWLNPEGQFLYISPSCTRITGYDPQDFISDPELRIRLVHPEDLERFRLHVKEVEQKRSAGEVEFRIVRKDGTIRWISHACQPVYDSRSQYLGIRGSKRDITDRRQREETLRKNKERFELLSETAGLLLSTQNPQQIVNDLCLKVMTFLDCDVFFNYLFDEKVKRLQLNAYSGIPEKAAEEIEWLDLGCAVCGTVARDGSCIVAENIPDTPDPRTELICSFGVKAYACHPLVSAGRVIGTLSFGARFRTSFAEEELQLMKTVADQISIAIERKKAEEDTRRLRDELAHVMRIATMGELAASLAHELNQPLTAILSNAQAAQRFLLSDSPDMEEVCEALKDIIEDDQRAGEVIRGLRALLEKEERKQSLVNMNKIIEETITLLHGELLQKGSSITFYPAPGLPTLMGDRVQLQQVVMNLVMNAFEAMKDNKPGTKKITIVTAVEDPGKIKVSITDSGTGIKPENKDLIFTPFFTTKPRGMGMGLSINRSIIEAHGGSLMGINNPDRGATFSFTLPISLEDGG